MKKMKFTKIMLIIVLAVIISLPIMAVIKINATADSTSSVISNVNDGYTFFVIETTDTPLAMAPKDMSNQVGVIILITTLSILTLTYVVWCISISHNAAAISIKLPIHLRGNVKYTNAFLHPVKSYQYIKDAEYSVAQKYVYYN